METQSSRAYMDPDRAIATLVLEEVDKTGPDEEGVKIQIFPGAELRLGRDAGPDSLVITNFLVSKQHFRIYNIIYEDGDDPKNPPLIYCEDLESANGTWVNDTLIGKIGHPKKGYLLCDGDLIKIKPHWAFRFHQDLSGVSKDTDDVQEAEKQYFAHQYEIAPRVLGSGLSGTVYLAHDKFTGTQLACKIVDLRSFAAASPDNKPSDEESMRDENSPEFMKPRLPKRNRKTAQDLKNLRRELHILTQLDHPNVVRLKKAFLSKDTLFLFQELATGGDLFSYLCQKGGVLDDLHSRIICLQVALAIQYLHAQGVVHRDLKPENILVTHTDIGHRVLITDFGCAITVKNTPDRLMTQIGTPGYMAPEVLGVKQNGGYTKAIDMWSLGVVATCLLTGAYEFLTEQKRVDAEPGPTSEVLLRNLEDIAYAKGRWTNIEGHARDFISKLLCMNAEKRMTADQAINHRWFTRPKAVAAEIEQLYERANKHWKPRQETKLVEEIPNVVDISLPLRAGSSSYELLKQQGKFRKDYTVLKYWNRPTLEKHLRTAKPRKSERRAFVRHLQNPSSPIARDESPYKRQFVRGNNLFNRSTQLDLRTSKSTSTNEEQPPPLNALNSSITNSRSNLLEVEDSQQNGQRACSPDDLHKYEDAEEETIPDSQEYWDNQMLDYDDDCKEKQDLPHHEEAFVHNRIKSKSPRWSQEVPDSQENLDVLMADEYTTETQNAAYNQLRAR